VGELKKKRPKIEPGRWRAEVDIKAVSGGIAISGATVTGTWTVSGEGVEYYCVTGGPGAKCHMRSGWLTDAMSTTFTVTSISYPGYSYAPWDNVASQITIGKND
jgi:aminoglycoside N3'-acetyltransferase